MRNDCLTSFGGLVGGYGEAFGAPSTHGEGDVPLRHRRVNRSHL